MSDMGPLSAQFDIQADIAKIISRLDTLEKKVSHIQDQKSS
jgi:tetrahydromethanopterin S-methyltransferase subunit G